MRTYRGARLGWRPWGLKAECFILHRPSLWISNFYSIIYNLEDKSNKDNWGAALSIQIVEHVFVTADIIHIKRPQPTAIIYH